MESLNFYKNILKYYNNNHDYHKTKIIHQFQQIKK